MRENSAMMLLDYLYDQLDMLGSLDMGDTEGVASACSVNRAVNDTARSILAVADLSIRAMGATPTLGRRNLLAGFFEEGDAE